MNLAKMSKEKAKYIRSAIESYYCLQRIDCELDAWMRVLDDLDALRAELAQVRASAQEVLDNSISLATYNSLRAELKVAQEENVQLRAEWKKFFEDYRERDVRRDEKISQLTRERGTENETLHKAQKACAGLARERDGLSAENGRLRYEIARLRDERRLLAEVTLRQDDVITEQRDELDRMRKALERIATDDWGYEGGRVVFGNESLDEFYKGYNAGIKAQFAKTQRLATRALNPQPAPPDPVAPVST